MGEVKGPDATEMEKNESLNPLLTDGENTDVVDQKSLAGPGRVSGPARKSKWTAEEDEKLRDAVQNYEGKGWKRIASCLPDRTDVQCLHRWQKVLNPDLVKGPWTKEEDDLIIELVEKNGTKKWSEIAKQLPGRIGKQCRERWFNHLRSDINKDPWTLEEEQILVSAHSVYGNKWAEIAKIYLPRRTENSIKNHWNGSLKKKLDNYLALGYSDPGSNLPTLTSNESETRLSSVETSKTQGKISPLKEIVECGNNSGELCLLLEHPEDVAQYPSPSNMDDLSKIMNLATTEITKVADIGESDWLQSEQRLTNSDPMISGYLPHFLNFPLDAGHDDSDIHYTGLCYEPLQKEDLNTFLSSARFPSTTDKFIRKPSNSSSTPSSSGLKESSDSNTSPASILRCAAMSYGNVPSIIRKRDKLDVSLEVGKDSARKTKDDEVSRGDDAVLSSPKCQKIEAIQSVGKSLEKEFSDAYLM